MSFTGYVIGFFVGLAVFLLLDAIWLGVLARTTYQKYLGHLMAKKPFWPAAVAFYGFFIVGLLILVVGPHTRNYEPGVILFKGAVYGFACYMTYDLTNWAVVQKWPSRIVFIDIAWGTFLAAATTGGIVAVLKMLEYVRLAT